MSFPVVPLVGMAGGAALMVVGSGQLNAAWLAPEGSIAPGDRARIGWVAVGLIGLGTALEAVSTFEMQMRLRDGREEPDDE